MQIIADISQFLSNFAPKLEIYRKYTRIMAEAIDIRELNIRIEQQSTFVTNLVSGMDRVIVGQKHLVDSLLIGLLSDGHILL